MVWLGLAHAYLLFSRNDLYHTAAGRICVAHLFLGGAGGGTEMEKEKETGMQKRRGSVEIWTGVDRQSRFCIGSFTDIFSPFILNPHLPLIKIPSYTPQTTN